MGAYKILGLANDTNNNSNASYKILGKDPATIDQNTEQQDPGAYLDSLSNNNSWLTKLPRNILIGLSKLGHSTTNLPYDLAKNIEQQGQQFSNNINQQMPIEKYAGNNQLPGGSNQQNLLEQFIKQNNIPDSARNPSYNQSFAEHIPHQQEQNYEQLLGQQGEGTLADKLIQKGIEYAPEIASGKALLKGAMGRLKGTHQLNKVQKFTKENAISDFDYPSRIINEAKKFLPKTEASKELINQVKSGDYQAAFKLQSQIGHHQRQLAKSPLASENSIMAPKAGELKQKMLGHLEDILRSANHHEEADMLKSGINNFRQYKKVMNVAKPILIKLGIGTPILTALGFAFNQGKKALME